MVIRVLVVDDEAIVRDGLRTIIDLEPDLEVVGEAANGEDALAVAQQLTPDVALVDIQMPVLDGIETTRRLARLTRPPKVLLLTTFDRNEFVYEGMKAGAGGFLLKDVRRGQLTDAIRAIMAGDTLISPAVTRRLIEEFCRLPSPSASRPAGLALLTAREVEVLALVGRGRSNAEIAQDLVVAETTVRTHVSRLLTKLDLRDRAQAVVVAYESGLIRPGS
ncbi:MAG TPA: DNA-binding response regulator [Chloroflexi bacterium]|jgi:DNA-binding NarL/FixJ family response regulator|nr:DNA-binding response regulator [Chloroflexota bacterium]